MQRKDMNIMRIFLASLSLSLSLVLDSTLEFESTLDEYVSHT